MNEEERAIKIKSRLSELASIAHIGEIVQSNSEKSIIGTIALDTCYGIVFYDRKNKRGYVGHATPSSKIKTLQEMLNLLEKAKTVRIEYAIIPGYRNEERKDYRGFAELINYLESHCPENITLIPFQSDLGIQVDERTSTYEFAFEVNSGLPVSQYLFYESPLKRKNK